jgi:hypothetical protein
LLLLVLVGAPSLASAASGAGVAWLRDHADLEWVVAQGGWRSSLGNDQRAPGFSVFAGGGELCAGLDIAFGLGVVAVGRVLAGAGGGYSYFEGTGGAALQLRVSRVRVRLGAVAGQVSYGDDSATMVGGLLAGSFDLFSLGGGRLSTALTARLDVDGNLGARVRLPDESLALAIGLGFRY